MKAFVTGGQGFIGAWITRLVLREHKGEVTIFDVAENNGILSQVLTPEELGSVKKVYGNIAEFEQVKKAIEDCQPNVLIHLAGLQVPTCRGNPVLGATVNVVGTVNVFESVKQLVDEKKMNIVPVVYASSAAVAGPPEDYTGPIMDDAQHRPTTHYGVFKQANEGNARVYWLDNKIPSIGLRPHTVYGVGREFGLTSGPTKALKAMVLGREYAIQFSGKTLFSYVEDVARMFIEFALVTKTDAVSMNVPGHVMHLEDFIVLMDTHLPGSKDKVSFGGPGLPLAFDLDSSVMQKLLGKSLDQLLTPLSDGVAATVSLFQELQKSGSLHDRDL